MGDGWLRRRTPFIPLCILHDNEPGIPTPSSPPFLCNLLRLFLSPFSRFTRETRARCVRDVLACAFVLGVYNADITTHAYSSPSRSDGINGFHWATSFFVIFRGKSKIAERPSKQNFLLPRLGWTERDNYFGRGNGPAVCPFTLLLLP